MNPIFLYWIYVSSGIKIQDLPVSIGFTCFPLPSSADLKSFRYLLKLHVYNPAR